MVTGAAVYTGSHLIKALLERGYKVRALVRNTPLDLEHENLECFNSEEDLHMDENAPVPTALRSTVTAWQWLHVKLGIPAPIFSAHELNKLTISHMVNSAAAVRDFGCQPVKSVADATAESIEYSRARRSY